MYRRALFLFVAIFALSAGSTRAAEQIEAALYLAENTPPADEAKLAPEQLAHRLREVFGYKHYNLLKSEKFSLDQPWAQWLVERNDFFMRIEPLPHVKGEPRAVDYEIYKEGFSIAKGRYEPADDTPLFINGPDFKHGRLIFVIEPR